jgi:triacylglycerol esterase/lipase EstA (alpha/beta hydrolase family)
MDTLNGIGDIRESAEQLASFVKKVLSITGASQVDLIGYSEGSLVSL